MSASGPSRQLAKVRFEKLAKDPFVMAAVSKRNAVASAFSAKQTSTFGEALLGVRKGQEECGQLCSRRIHTPAVIRGRCCRDFAARFGTAAWPETSRVRLDRPNNAPRYCPPPKKGGTEISRTTRLTVRGFTCAGCRWHRLPYGRALSSPRSRQWRKSHHNVTITAAPL
jgi:hypothetical protein